MLAPGFTTSVYCFTEYTENVMNNCVYEQFNDGT